MFREFYKLNILVNLCSNIYNTEFEKTYLTSSDVLFIQIFKNC